MKSKSKKMNENLKEVRSINKNIRSSVRKLNPILKSLVGKKVEIALRNLSFSEKRITRDIKKTISSAVANAAPILKPYSNLTIILSEKQNKEVKHGPKS